MLYKVFNHLDRKLVKIKKNLPVIKHLLIIKSKEE